MVKDNQDYFKRGGRSGGPAGPRKQFKDKLSRQQAMLRRDEEHKIPGERRVSGKRRMNAAEEAEAQLASLHQEQHSVLDELPKPVGAAGVPRSARPVPTARRGGRKASPGREAGEASFDGGPFSRELEEEEAPYGYAIPASEDAALGHEREPFERERSEMRHAAHEQERAQRRSAHEEQRRAGDLGPVQRRLVRTFPPIFRAVGEAARAVDRPIRNALETLQLLGRAARRQS